MTTVKRFLGIVWAGPNTLLGLAIGAFGLVTGGQGRRVGKVVEFWGGAVTWGLTRLVPIPGGALAMTIGHVILGQSAESLDICRRHELVHVGQYERWGIFFLPAYFAASSYLWFKGRDTYRGNPFEVVAYAVSDPADHERDDPANYA